MTEIYYDELLKKEVFKKERVVLSIGFFDGVHSGHKALLYRLVAESKARGIKSLVITFDKNPKIKDSIPLTSYEEKVSQISLCNVDELLVIRWNDEIKQMSGKDFLSVIQKYYDIEAIVCGKDFSIGNRTAEVNLKELKKIFKGNIIVLDDILSSDLKRVSSTSLRKSRKENLERIYIVLAWPMDGQNIGSVCRAMKTMGLNHLRIVTNTVHSEERVRQLSVHAYDLWENREVFKDLKSALSDMNYSIAATRRKGKFRKLSILLSEELPQFVNKISGKIAIVFGPESNGLSDSDVAECNDIVTIPTSPNFPSLNLAQAVQIIVYELFKQSSDYSVTNRGISQSEITLSMAKLADNYEKIGLVKTNTPEKESFYNFFKDFVSRANLSHSEFLWFIKFLDKIAKMYENKKES